MSIEHEILSLHEACASLHTAAVNLEVWSTFIARDARRFAELAERSRVVSTPGNIAERAAALRLVAEPLDILAQALADQVQANVRIHGRNYR